MKKVLAAIIFPAILLAFPHLVVAQPSGSLDQALIQAADQGDAAQVQQLLDKGANIEAKDEQGYTALYRAAYRGNADLVKLLLAKGAETYPAVSALNHEMIDQFRYGRCADVDKIAAAIEMLGEKPNFNFRSENGITPLIAVSSFPSSNLGCVNYLLDHGARVNDFDELGDTPLIHAVQEYESDAAYENVIRILLAKGAQPNVTDRIGDAALNRAIGFAEVAIVKLLIDNGANVNLANRFGMTPDDCARSFKNRSENLSASDRKKNENLTQIATLLERAGAQCKYACNMQ